MIEMLQHSCTISRSVNDRRLNFDAGSAVFTLTKTLTGATSHATGIVKSLTKSTGEWSTNNAAGYMDLSNVTGAFTNDEVIADNSTVHGAAVANGVDVESVDAFGIPARTTTTTTVRCLFVSPKGGLKKLESGEALYNLPAVILPSGTAITEGDTLTGVTSGFTKTYRVKYVRTLAVDEGPAMLRVDLEAVD